jgi:DNA-binding transcriptional ArsR family regulator
VTQVHVDEAFKALASPQRREILRLLGSAGDPAGKACCGPSEVCACKLAEQLGLAPSTVSHHMSALREAGLVHARKGGQWVYYTLDRDALHEVIALLQEL